MSKYKEFKDYVYKIWYQLDDKELDCFPDATIVNKIDVVLECYLTCVKPKDCAKKILGEVDE